MNNPIQIRWADGEDQRLGVDEQTVPKLFVGSIPKHATEVLYLEDFPFSHNLKGKFTRCLFTIRTYRRACFNERSRWNLQRLCLY